MNYNLWIFLNKDLWRLQSWHSNGAHRGPFYRFRSGTVTALRLNTSHHKCSKCSGEYPDVLLKFFHLWVTSSHRMIDVFTGKVLDGMCDAPSPWRLARPHLTSRCFTATAGPTLLRPLRCLQHPPNRDIMISRLSVKSSDQGEAVLVLHASTEISFRCRQIVFIPCTSCISWN